MGATVHTVTSLLAAWVLLELSWKCPVLLSVSRVYAAAPQRDKPWAPRAGEGSVPTAMPSAQGQGGPTVTDSGCAAPLKPSAPPQWRPQLETQPQPHVLCTHFNEDQCLPPSPCPEDRVGWEAQGRGQGREKGLTPGQEAVVWGQEGLGFHSPRWQPEGWLRGPWGRTGGSSPGSR